MVSLSKIAILAILYCHYDLVFTVPAPIPLPMEEFNRGLARITTSGRSARENRDNTAGPLHLQGHSRHDQTSTSRASMAYLQRAGISRHDQMSNYPSLDDMYGNLGHTSHGHSSGQLYNEGHDQASLRGDVRLKRSNRAGRSSGEVGHARHRIGPHPFRGNNPQDNRTEANSIHFEHPSLDLSLGPAGGSYQSNFPFQTNTASTQVYTPQRYFSPPEVMHEPSDPQGFSLGHANQTFQTFGVDRLGDYTQAMKLNSVHEGSHSFVPRYRAEEGKEEDERRGAPQGTISEAVTTLREQLERIIERSKKLLRDGSQRIEFTLQVNPYIELNFDGQKAYDAMTSEQCAVVIERIHRVRPYTPHAIQTKISREKNGKEWAEDILGDDEGRRRDAIERIYPILRTKQRTAHHWMEGLDESQRRSVIDIVAKETQQSTDALLDAFLSREIPSSISHELLSCNKTRRWEIIREYSLILPDDVNLYPWQRRISQIQQHALIQRMTNVGLERSYCEEILSQPYVPDRIGKALLLATASEFDKVIQSWVSVHPIGSPVVSPLENFFQ